MSETLIHRSIAWLVNKQRERLAGLDAMADLEPFRETARRVRSDVDSPSPRLLEAVDLLEAEIREREVTQERARRVLSDGDSKSKLCEQK